jgi:hypothetical protein
MSRLSRQCGILNISQLYRSPRPVTGIALLFLLLRVMWDPSLCLAKTCGGVNIQIKISLTSALDGGEWSASRPCRFTAGERAPVTHWVGLVGRITGLNDVEEGTFLTLPRLELGFLSRPARSQSLYRLRYPGFSIRADISLVKII